MNWRAQALGLIVVSFTLIPILTTPAEAKIRCSGAYQIVQGQHIATPYCGDQYLAQVARTYGMRVSGRALRRSQSLKEETCQLIGHDNRVSDICTGFRNESDGNDNGRNRR